MAVRRATISCLYYSQVCQNIVYFWDPDGTIGDSGTATIVRNEWVGSAANHGIKSWVGNHIQWFNVKVQEVDVSVPPAPFSLTFSQGGQQSASNGEYTPCGIILQLKTDRGGRHGRGRSYVPGILVGFFTNGVTNSTFHSYADTAIATMNTQFTGGSPASGLHVCLWDRVAKEKTLVTSIQASNFVGIQRRRNIGYGI